MNETEYCMQCGADTSNPCGCVEGDTSWKEAMQFSKVLAKFYIKWFQDCHDSAIYCRKEGDVKRAEYYLERASIYLTIIMENWDAIEFFSADEKRAFIYAELLPKEFQKYK